MKTDPAVRRHHASPPTGGLPGPSWFAAACAGVGRLARRSSVGSRRGSVLILVVALLVLMALIGTAFITSSGNDRVSTAKNTEITTADLAAKTMADAATSVLVQKIAPSVDPVAVDKLSSVDGSKVPTAAMIRYRQAIKSSNIPAFELLNSTQVPQFYTDVDYVPWDTMLASRYPELLAPAQPAWTFISNNPLGGIGLQPSQLPLVTAGSFVPEQFRSPLRLSDASYSYSYGSRANMQPVAIALTTLNGQTLQLPAFRIRNTTTGGEGGRLVQAMDADGDGIADAGMIELPMAETNGIRWYAGLRIVDNSAAINSSVAWEPVDQVSNESAVFSTGNQLYPTATPNPAINLLSNVFPVNVNLRGLLLSDGLAGLNRLNYERFGRQGTIAAPVVSLVPYRDDATSNQGRKSEPGFRFATQYDAFWTMLGSRLDNPGWWNLNNTGNDPARYRAMGLTESAAMAHGFAINSQSGSTSVLETALPLGTGVQRYISGTTPNPVWQATNRPYRADQAFASTFDGDIVRSWYSQLFDYDTFFTNGQQVPLRPLLTGHNAVSNFAPGIIGTTGTPIADVDREGRYVYASGTVYRPGDWVKATGGAFVCFRANSGVAPPTTSTDPGAAYWAYVPWHDFPTKLNVNTSNFGALYAAYQLIMADGPRVPPPGGTADPDNVLDATEIPYRFTFGNVVRPFGDGTAVRTLGNDAATPIGEATTAYLMKQLRAAIAAVNAIDMRDQDHDVTSRTVALTDSAGTVRNTATVFGTEAQPYITEVVVNYTVMGQPYVCVELFNPYPFRLSLNAFMLAYRSRSGSLGDLQPIDRANLVTGAAIEPYSSVYFESSTANRPVDVTFPVGATPRESTNLANLVIGNNEFVLLRTRRYDGAVTSNTNLMNTYKESFAAGPAGSARLDDLVPVDQLEFTGIIQQTAADPAAPLNRVPAPTRYHYRRANRAGAATAAANRWHCVYAGPYNSKPTAAAGAPAERRQRGWVAEFPNNPIDFPLFDPADPMSRLGKPGFGLEKDQTTVVSPIPQNTPNGASYPPQQATYRTRTLQMNSAGQGGPWQAPMDAADGAYTTATPAQPRFPVGGFLRNGDLLQVPIVGGYILRDAANTVSWETNSVTMDAVFAEDGDFADNEDASVANMSRPVEQLGRPCPIVGVGTINDLAVDASGTNSRYHWATDLFDLLTVISPQDDYLPNVDPVRFDPTMDAAATPTPNRKWPPNMNSDAYADLPAGPSPQAVGNTLQTSRWDKANGGREDGAAIHGLINVNTANWRVLAAVPFTKDPARNAYIAKAIVKSRDGDPAAGTPGKPYRNLFDLLRVPEFRTTTVSGGYGGPPTTLMGDGTPYNLANSNPGNIDGDVTPLAPQWTNPPALGPNPVQGLDDVWGDFESRYMTLIRVSNMLTFRSDSFTVYVVVQGWRNANTSAPELVIERRTARIVDRSMVRPTNGIVTTDVQVTSPAETPLPQN